MPIESFRNLKEFDIFGNMLIPPMCIINLNI